MQPKKREKIHPYTFDNIHFCRKYLLYLRIYGEVVSSQTKYWSCVIFFFFSLFNSIQVSSHTRTRNCLSKSHTHTYTSIRKLSASKWNTGNETISKTTESHNLWYFFFQSHIKLCTKWVHIFFLQSVNKFSQINYVHRREWERENKFTYMWKKKKKWKLAKKIVGHKMFVRFVFTHTYAHIFYRAHCFSQTCEDFHFDHCSEIQHDIF